MNLIIVSHVLGGCSSGRCGGGGGGYSNANAQASASANAGAGSGGYGGHGGPGGLGGHGPGPGVEYVLSKICIYNLRNISFIFNLSCPRVENDLF